ncbi:MAG: hypothetical protein JXA68_11735 [Ignavibacteriales bacterium]|nr:hypothetical protein [Ignavibacteriales bacterium]
MSRNRQKSIIWFLIALFLPGFIAISIFGGGTAAIVLTSIIIWSIVAISTILIMNTKTLSSTPNTSQKVFYKNMDNECPLSNIQIENTISNIGLKNGYYDFDSYDFIEKCPIGVKNCDILTKSENKIPCGRRLGRYRTETHRIIDQSNNSGKRGRKWKVQTNIPLISGIIKPATFIEIPPITIGHKRALKWYSSHSFLKIKEAYDKVFGYNNVYFRVIDKGVTAISLDLNCPSFLGINANRNDESCYIYTNSIVKPLNSYIALKRDFDQHKKTIKRISAEEKAVIKYIRYSLQNKLSLMNLPEGYYFLNNEWRFLDFNQGGKKSDILGININNGSLVIIEFKSNKSKRNTAIEQVKLYSSLYLNAKTEYDNFFGLQFCAICNLYLGNDQHNKELEFNLKPELFIAYPENNDIVIEKVL